MLATRNASGFRSSFRYNRKNTHILNKKFTGITTKSEEEGTQHGQQNQWRKSRVQAEQTQAECIQSMIFLSAVTFSFSQQTSPEVFFFF